VGNRPRARVNRSRLGLGVRPGPTSPEVFGLHAFPPKVMLERAFLRAGWWAAVVVLFLWALSPEAGGARTSPTYLAAFGEARPPDARASILVYHRFGPVVADSMTVRTSTFRWQLEYLRSHGYQVIPLREWIAWRLHLGPPPPSRSVVITVDDGHRSVFTEMLPLVREFGVPVTLFIYPSAISNAAYALTWDQLRTLTATGLFDVQSHSYWHPNFATEKRRLPAPEYRAFAVTQLTRSKAVLEQRLGANVDVIAWPFGIYDEELLQIGVDAGYLAGVTLDRRVATANDPILALPRFLVTDNASGRQFAALLPPESP
jgi:peptidoglycan/xylan/chitin deacetylase (PgdA/CDA1 family)